MLAIIWNRQGIGIEQKPRNVVFHDILRNDLDYDNVTWGKNLFK